MSIEEIVAIIGVVLSVGTIIYQTGAITQVIKELKKISSDHEQRLRRIETRRIRNLKNAEKNQNRM